MRLVSFTLDGRPGYGAVTEDDRIARLDGADAPPTLAQWLAEHHGHRSLPAHVEHIDLAAAVLLPPIPDPAKILCVATNFHEPSRAGKPVPDYPLLFLRTAEAQVGHGAAILQPAVSQMLDFEGELAVVLGRAGHRIPIETAMDHVAGYACFNDGSVRDWQKHSSQFTPGKNFYASGAFGPWIVTADAVPDPYALHLRTRVNGVEKQSIAMRDMIFDIAWLIAYCSTFAPLRAGDVIATGTPSGFGSSRTPPEFLRPGDIVEVDILGVGLLRNHVTASPF